MDTDFQTVIVAVIQVGAIVIFLLGFYLYTRLSNKIDKEKYRIDQLEWKRGVMKDEIERLKDEIKRLRDSK